MSSVIFWSLALLAAGVEATKPAEPAFFEVKGKVIKAGPPPNAAIAKIAVECKTAKQTVEAEANDQGAFAVKVPLEETYRLRVKAPGYAPVVLEAKRENLGDLTVVIDPNAKECCEFHPVIVGFKGFRPIILVISLALLYWATAILIRKFNIIDVNRRMILAGVRIMRAREKARRIRSEQEEAQSEPVHRSWKDFLKELRKDPTKSVRTSGDFLADLLFGFRGAEVAARAELLERDVALIASYSREEIASKLRFVVEKLRPEYKTIADKTDAVLAKLNDVDAPSTDFLRATLVDATIAANEKSEAAARDMLNWQNKAFALIFIGCCLLVIVSLVLPHPVLLLLGFLGGFTSRLLRGRTESNTNAGLSWTALLMSPLYGAFAGWAGVLIMTALATWGVIGGAVFPVQWESASCSSIGLGIAFLFGFSERFFSAVTDMAESAATKQKSASMAGDGSASGAAAAATAGASGTAAAGIPVVMAFQSAQWNPLTQTVLFRGKGLQKVSDLKLRNAAGTEVGLTIDAANRTNELVEAKAAANVAAGNWDVLADGKSAGVSITV